MTTVRRWPLRFRIFSARSGRLHFADNSPSAPFAFGVAGARAAATSGTRPRTVVARAGRLRFVDASPWVHILAAPLAPPHHRVENPRLWFVVEYREGWVGMPYKGHQPLYCEERSYATCLCTNASTSRDTSSQMPSSSVHLPAYTSSALRKSASCLATASGPAVTRLFFVASGHGRRVIVLRRRADYDFVKRLSFGGKRITTLLRTRLATGSEPRFRRAILNKGLARRRDPMVQSVLARRKRRTRLFVSLSHCCINAKQKQTVCHIIGKKTFFLLSMDIN